MKFRIMLIAIAFSCVQTAACQSVESPIINSSNDVYYLLGKDTIYKKVDVLPEFVSGKAAREMWLRRNVKMPAITEANNAYGDVVCTFVVKKDGTVIDAQCVSSPDVYSKKEVMRNIPHMEKWSPGMIDGRPVNTLYTMIVNFNRDGCLYRVKFK